MADHRLEVYDVSNYEWELVDVRHARSSEEAHRAAVALRKLGRAVRVSPPVSIKVRRGETESW